MENETACGCGCVDVLGQGPETYQRDRPRVSLE